ncbi:MAG: hypothetical protein ACO1RX_03715 [Candidatus Sericytochromatia bacterium]
MPGVRCLLCRLVPVLLMGLLGACAARQERVYLEGAEAGLVLLQRQPGLPLEQELQRLFERTQAELGALPGSVRGWLRPLGPALQRLHVASLRVAGREPVRLQQAMAPYRLLASYPVAVEQVKIPADLALAPLVQRVNLLLAQMWRAEGALWLAGKLDPQLARPRFDGDAVELTGVSVGAVSQLYLLLQVARGERPSGEQETLLQALLNETRARRERLQARLQAGSEQPRVVQDDLELLRVIEQSLLRARVRWADTRQRLERRLLDAGDRIEALAAHVPA